MKRKVKLCFQVFLNHLSDPVRVLLALILQFFTSLFTINFNHHWPVSLLFVYSNSNKFSTLVLLFTPRNILAIAFQVFLCFPLIFLLFHFYYLLYSSFNPCSFHSFTSVYLTCWHHAFSYKLRIVPFQFLSFLTPSLSVYLLLSTKHSSSWLF